MSKITNSLLQVIEKHSVKGHLAYLLKDDGHQKLGRQGKSLPAVVVFSTASSAAPLIGVFVLAVCAGLHQIPRLLS